MAQSGHQDRASCCSFIESFTTLGVIRLVRKPAAQKYLAHALRLAVFR
jgi:hypothetical protein